jgi:hypothetical protein
VAHTLHVPNGRGRPRSLSISLSAAVRFRWHELDEALAQLGDESVEQAHLRLVAEVEEEASFRRQQEVLYRTIVDLPQLFIAV